MKCKHLYALAQKFILKRISHGVYLVLGYQGNGVVCLYVGVCSVNNGGCHPLATCEESSSSKRVHYKSTGEYITRVLASFKLLHYKSTG